MKQLFQFVPYFVLGILILVLAIFILIRSGQPSQINQLPSIATESAQMPAIEKKSYDQFPGVLPQEEMMDKKARIATSNSEIVFEIFSEEAPKAASNFIFLAADGFYDGLNFHRVEPGFVIQGGDPKGDGTGGPGYQFEDEPVTRDYDRGIVAMANAGPNSNGSQFFIMLEDNKTLPKNYTIFGKVTEGMDVVSQIEVGDVMEKVTIE